MAMISCAATTEMTGERMERVGWRLCAKGLFAVAISFWFTPLQAQTASALTTFNDPAPYCRAAGAINAPEMVEEIISNGRVDPATLGRSLLFDPYWPKYAAKVLEAQDIPWPVQYECANVF